MKVSVRKGDWFILAGAAVIVAYEKVIQDDEDLISRRVAVYRRTRLGRLITDAAILTTALHLTEICPPKYDIYHHLMRRIRAQVKVESNV